MQITYQVGTIPPVDDIIEVLESSGINRPTSDKARIALMYERADLVVTAWDGELLVGAARSLTDFCYCCYLSGLAVRKEYQKQGIGKRMVEITREQIGEQTSLILVAAPGAVNYYPKIGMQKLENGYIIKRTS